MGFFSNLFGKSEESIIDDSIDTFDGQLDIESAIRSSVKAMVTNLQAKNVKPDKIKAIVKENKPQLTSMVKHKLAILGYGDNISTEVVAHDKIKDDLIKDLKGTMDKDTDEDRRVRKELLEILKGIEKGDELEEEESKTKVKVEKTKA